MDHAEELASLFGPALTSFIGKDDKATVARPSETGPGFFHFRREE